MNYKLDTDRLRARHSNTWRFYLLNEAPDTLALKDFEINSGTVCGNDPEGLRRIKPIRNILFAYPAEKVSDVKPYIEKVQLSKSVTKMQLKTTELRQALKKYIVLTMCEGYVIRGKLQKFDDYRLFMRVGSTDVQVYRHGLLNLEKKEDSNQTKTDDRHKVSKKRSPERVEASRPKTKKAPSQTKANDRNKTRKKRQPEGDEAETMVELAKVLKAQGKSPEEIIDRLNTEKRRAERLTIQLSDAEEKQYEIRARSIRSTRSTIDPSTRLRNQYTEFNNMECQMCRQEMPFKKRNSDEDYFEAVEVFGKDYFPKEHEAQHLALCPECAAKYKEYVKKDRAAREVLYNLLKDSDEPEVHLELNDCCVIRICFDEKHWHDLKTVLHYYENVYDAENSTD